MHNLSNDESGVYLELVQIDDSGRLVIPPDVLQRMGWTEGQRLDVGTDAAGRLTLRLVLQH